jgi:hypothetical protein
MPRRGIAFLCACIESTVMCCPVFFYRPLEFLFGKELTNPAKNSPYFFKKWLIFYLVALVWGM